MLQKAFGSDSKMLSAVGLDSRPSTPKDKDSSMSIMNKGDMTPNSLKHKMSTGTVSSSNNSIKKSNNKKARHR